MANLEVSQNSFKVNQKKRIVKAYRPSMSMLDHQAVSTYKAMGYEIIMLEKPAPRNTKIGKDELIKYLGGRQDRHKDL